jgi:acetyl esterase/lipase
VANIGRQVARLGLGHDDRRAIATTDEQYYRWTQTKEAIADYGGDPNFVAISGLSAGGHLSALAALTPHVSDFQPGSEDVDTSVAAAVPLYGAFDFLNRGRSWHVRHGRHAHQGRHEVRPG